MATIIGGTTELEPTPGAVYIVVEGSPQVESSSLGQFIGHIRTSAVTIRCYGETESGAKQLAEAVLSRHWPRAEGLIMVRPLAGPSFAERPLGGRLRAWRFDALFSVVYDRLAAPIPAFELFILPMVEVDDVVLLAITSAPASRQPVLEPEDRSFLRRTVIAGHSGTPPLTEEDVSQLGSGVIAVDGDWRGNDGNAPSNDSAERGNVFNYQPGEHITSWIGTAKLYFLLSLPEGTGLAIQGVTDGNGADIPLTRQTELTTVSGDEHNVWYSNDDYASGAHPPVPYTLTLVKESGFPNSYNRYIGVSQDAIPTALVLTEGEVGAGSDAEIPRNGWEDGRGYIHIGLPCWPG